MQSSIGNIDEPSIDLNDPETIDEFPRIKSLQIGMTGVERELGGVDRVYFNLVRELPHSGVDVHGLVVGDEESENTLPREVATFASKSSGMVSRWRGMRNSAARLIGDSDIVAAHFAPYAFPILDMAARKPLVIHFHGPWALESKAAGVGAVGVTIREIVERIVYARGARFIVLSTAFASQLAEHYGVARSRIEIVPGGVDIGRFSLLTTRLAARAALGWPTDRKIGVAVRRLVPAKGIENLINAVGAIRERHPEFLMYIVGTGPLEAALRKTISDAGLEDSVRLSGFVSDADLPNVYRAADISIVPTVALEGFGLVVLESLASGTPALVTPICGLPDVVRALSTDLILAGPGLGDVKHGLERYLEGSLNLPNELECREYARGFSWQNIAKLTSEVYRRVLNS